MTPDRETLRIIGSWMEDGRTRLPDRVLDAVLDQLPSTPQRRPVGSARRFPVMPAFAKVAAAAVAIVAIGLVGLTLGRHPSFGPAASPSPSASPSPVTPTPSPRSEAERIIAEGGLQAFAETAGGTLLTVWDTCKSELDTDCGIAWRLGTGSRPQATGVLSRVDFHPGVFASGDGFILTPPRGSREGIRIAQDGTSSPLSMACVDAGWSTPTEPGRLAFARPAIVDTVTGSICDMNELGGRPLSRGALTPEGTLWALVDNSIGPDTLTIGQYDGVEWAYHDFDAASGVWTSGTSVLAASGSTVVVLLANPEPSPRPDRMVGVAVTTDAGATWSEAVDAVVLERDFPFSAVVSADNEDLYSGYTSMAFAGPSTVYVADGNGDLWRSTDLATFSQVPVPGGVRDLQSAGDAVMGRTGDGNDLVRISADGTVEPITPR